MPSTPSVTWNGAARLILSDVDETIAEVYTPAEPAMIKELASLLQEGCKLFLVTGGDIRRVMHDITDQLPRELRHDILVSHCRGAEVWGFGADGTLKDTPFYSLYEETFDKTAKVVWRQTMDRLIQEFGLRKHPIQTKTHFWDTVGNDPLDIIYDDRGPQITLAVLNGIDLSSDQLDRLPYEVTATRGRYDLRVAIAERARQLFADNNVPAVAHVAGGYSIDMSVAGVSKEISIRRALADNQVLKTIGLHATDVQNPHELEIWGDKFVAEEGGADHDMCLAVPPQVRAIDFRDEDPAKLPSNSTVVLWDGRHRLHHGLLEYLQSRH